MQIQKDIKFYDTKSFLSEDSRILKKEKFLISGVTFDQISEEKKKIFLSKFKGQIIRSLSSLNYIIDNEKILADLFYANNSLYIDRIIFVTQNIELKEKANLFLGDKNIILKQEQ